MDAPLQAKKIAERVSTLHEKHGKAIVQIVQNIIQLETATLGPVNETSR